VAGSRGMSGAAVLCGSAALRAGAGLVRVALPHDVLPLVASANPCYMTAPLPQDEEGRLSDVAATELLSLAGANDVVAVGPGLGRSHGITSLVSALLRDVAVPLVVDADGLNAIAQAPECLGKRAAPLVLTPHPGEFGRLVKLGTTAVQAQRLPLAVR